MKVVTCRRCGNLKTQNQPCVVAGCSAEQRAARVGTVVKRRGGRGTTGVKDHYLHALVNVGRRELKLV